MRLGSIFLEVRRSNFAAIRLYSRTLHHRGRAAALYADNLEDALVMKLDLR